jgi:hypothetical protein
MHPASPSPADPLPDGHPAPPPAFSSELRQLLARFGDEPVSLGALLAATQQRGIHLLLLFIALPFVTPIPLPGLSIPFGAAVALLGARLSLGLAPRLPQVLLRRELPPRFLAGLLRAASRVMRVLECLLRPRLAFLQDHAAFGRLAGALVAVSGLFMILPLPLPFSNSLPAWTVLLLAAAALGRDGLFFIAGCVAFALSLAFFAFVAVGGTEAVDKLRLLFIKA